ncbi:FG-GAP-like repeat-containing protein [Streptomyces sp. DH12]|uniref:FG-GAP-like repeat-containing protein n=1 Tax=Streptomyces sp. DH12 TaxID=2857010 RepID=UPI001E37E31A|nr:FG-GAP-like repeat-containing protein [Streptomyces sp. DH12]
MGEQRHIRSAWRRLAVAVATSTALLATGGVAGAAPAAGEPHLPSFSMDVPDIPAGGTVTHTVEVEVSEPGRVTVDLRTADHLRSFVEHEWRQLNYGVPEGAGNATCRLEVLANGERRPACDLRPGTSTITYTLTAAEAMEAWEMDLRATFAPAATPETYGATERFSVLSDDPVELSYRVFGRDRVGNLWSYPTLTDGPPLAGGDGLGSGWSAFDALTKLSPIATNNRGGGVVAREPSGTLWYYPALGQRYGATGAFKPRVRVGTGWSIYSSVRGTGDVTGDGHADLIARDKAGVLWLYRGTGVEARPFAARTKVGSGWQVYNALTGGVDVTRDGHADLYARDTSGVLWLYRGTGDAARPYAPRSKVATGWGGYTAIIAPGEGSAVGKGALLVRDKDGRLWWFRGTGVASSPLAKPQYAADTSPHINAWM